jgi:hypothetical protein
LNGLGKGDTVSESVIRYGVPILGIGEFTELTSRAAEIVRRNATKAVSWNEDPEGKLQAVVE